MGATGPGTGFEPPDPATLLGRAAALTARPSFDAAAKAFCDEMIAFHAGRWALNAGLGYALGFAVSALIIHLDAAWPGGATTARLARICQAGRLAGPKAVRGAIAVFRGLGLVEADRDLEDRRARRLRPTPALVALMRENMAMRLGVQEGLTPFPEPAAAWARREGVLEAFLAGNVEAFAGSAFRLDEDYPEVRAFIDPQCGYLVLLSLISAELGGDGVSNPWPLAVMAEKFSVSRTHIRKMLAVGVDRGWLVRQGGGPSRIAPATLERLRRWIALEFAWTAQLVELRPPHPSARAP